MNLITHIQVIPVQPDAKSKLRAYINIEVARKFRIRNFRVIQGERGLFVAMPQMKKEHEGGKFIDLIKPLSKESNHELSKVILAEYHRVIKKDMVAV